MRKPEAGSTPACPLLKGMIMKRKERAETKNNPYSDMLEQVFWQQVNRLTWKCTGCYWMEACENNGKQTFNRYCDNFLIAAIRGDNTFEQPEPHVW